MAIIGILASLGVMSLSSQRRSLELSGYAQQFGTAIQGAASRANSRNEIYVIKFDDTGLTWGPATSGATIASCESGTAAPALTTTGAITVAKPAGVISPSGWLCVAAPGLISRLGAIPTCAYTTATVPCLTLSRGTVNRKVFVSASGQTEVQ